MRARRPAHEMPPRNDRADRHPACQPFGGTHDIRLDAKVFHSPPFAGTPDAALHLVGDEQNAMTIANLTQLPDKAGIRHDVTALALNRLKDDRGDRVWRDSTLEKHVLDEIGADAMRAAGRFFPAMH